MALFKAKQLAKEEFAELNTPKNVPSKVNSYLYHPHNIKAGSAASIIHSL
jgi:hypothetical protein